MPSRGQPIHSLPAISELKTDHPNAIMLTKGVDDRKSRYERESDRIQKFFGRPFFLSLTIGIPFCIFKLLFGVTSIRVGSFQESLSFLTLFGLGVTLWAGTDLVMNLGRAFLDLIHKPAPFEYCSIAQIGRFFRMPMLFLAIDTFLSFTIICLMLWSGWITKLTTPELYLWYAATTLNLISLSLVSLYTEAKRAGSI